MDLEHRVPVDRHCELGDLLVLEISIRVVLEAVESGGGHRSPEIVDADRKQQLVEQVGSLGDVLA